MKVFQIFKIIMKVHQMNYESSSNEYLKKIIIKAFQLIFYDYYLVK